MVLAFMDIWNIMDGSKKDPPSNVDTKVLKEFQKHIKIAMSITGLNLVDNCS